MVPARPSRRARVRGVVGVALLAPLTAELLQAYLGDLGGPLGLVVFVLFLAPLYGGAALLVREVSVRTGRGWPGRFLLAAAFGVAMPTLVDVSLFTVHRSDIDGWEDIVTAAAVGRIGVYAVVTWVGGHVLMSITAPLAVVESLVRAPGPWLGRVGLVVTVGLMVLVAALIHDSQFDYDVRVDAADYAWSAAVVIGLLVLAFTRLGRPLRREPGRAAPRPWVCVVTAFVLVAAFDLVPVSWVGVALDLGVLALGGLLVLRWSRSPQWDARRIAALAFGGVLARTLIGFLAPLPQQTTWPEKLFQNVSYLVIVLVLGVALARRTRGEAASYPTMGA
jgi:hypothetical protein